jgi:hypothetical protein
MMMVQELYYDWLYSSATYFISNFVGVLVTIGQHNHGGCHRSREGIPLADRAYRLVALCIDE